jgi:vacuolar-type H+-ATPase subunit F/Vma7
MAQLVVVTRPGVASGYLLAGVKAYAAPNAEAAQKIVDELLASRDVSLLAVDEAYMDAFPPEDLRGLQEHPECLVVGLPSGEREEVSVSRRERLAEGIRRAIGIQLPSLSEEGQEAER